MESLEREFCVIAAAVEVYNRAMAKSKKPVEWKVIRNRCLIWMVKHMSDHPWAMEASPAILGSHETAMEDIWEYLAKQNGMLVQQ